MFGDQLLKVKGRIGELDQVRAINQREWFFLLHGQRLLASGPELGGIFTVSLQQCSLKVKCGQPNPHVYR